MRIFMTKLATCVLAFIVSVALSISANAGDALVIYSAGVDGILVDAKDQGLANALKMIDDRLLELPAELNAPDIPAPAIQMVLQMLGGPMSLRAGMIEDADFAAGPPFYAQLDFYAENDEKATELSGRFGGMLNAIAPFPSQPANDYPGLQMMDLDGVPLYYGTMNVGGKSTFTLALNQVDDTAVNLDSAGLPEGVKPALAFILDTPKLQPVLDMIMMQAGPATEMAKQQLEFSGFYGPDAMTIDVACGYSADRSHVAARITKYRQMLEKMGGMTDGPLTADDLRLVPDDATYAEVGKYDFSSVGGFLEMMVANGMHMDQHAEDDGEPGEEQFDLMGMIESQTGIHPQRDIFAHLGDTAGFYMSDSTGNGGLLSSIFFLEVDNPDGLRETCTRLKGMINQLAQQFAKGYVRISTRTVNDRSIAVLTFPGIPVPFELSFAVTDGYLFGAASPQSLLAAIDQARNGKTSLRDNLRFKSMGGDDVIGSTQFEYLDTPRLLRDGYGLMSLVSAALSNAVRSPTDPDREPELVLPSYTDLRAEAKGTLYIAKMSGDDLVVTGQGDRSFVVNLCGTIGFLGGSLGTVALVGTAAAVILPAFAKQREENHRHRHDHDHNHDHDEVHDEPEGHSSREDMRRFTIHVKSATQLRASQDAILIYARGNKGELPERIEELVGVYFSEDLLHSPLGPVSDEEFDYWINLSFDNLDQVVDPEHQVFGFDRSSFAFGDKVIVGFFDGTVKQIAIDEFRKIIREHPNHNTDFRVPVRDPRRYLPVRK